MLNNLNMQYRIMSLLLLISLPGFAQTKKPIDHSVYDSWKSLSERMISNDGNYIVYSINEQEGDGELIVRNLKTGYMKIIQRGYAAVITEDSRYVICKIKPEFQENRQAKIKKKKADEMVKDSLALLQLGADSVIKISRVKSFKTPEKGAGWLAYSLEKPLPDTNAKKILCLEPIVIFNFML